MPTEPRLELLCTLTAELGPAVAIGDTPHGTRLIVPVTGGTVDGPRLKGKMLPGGGDWVLVRPDGVGELDVRSTIETHDGALLYASYRGYITRIMELIPRWSQGEAIPPEEHYFATTPYFETSASSYDWLQQTIAVGIGRLIPPGKVQYDIFTVG